MNERMTGYPSIDKPWLKYYSEEAIDAALPECTVYDYLWENNKDHLEDVAINYFDRKITYGEVFDNIEKAAKAFSALGVKQGDIIVMATVTTPETIYAFYGLNRIGTIANMVDPRTSAEGIKEYITEVGANIVLTIDAIYSKIEKAIIGTAVNQIIVTSPSDSLPQPKKFLFNLSNKFKKTVPTLNAISLHWNDFVAKGKNTTPDYVPYRKNICCLIVHTGGTTGSPKSVMLSNDNLNAASWLANNSPLLMKRGSVLLNIFPPFLAFGMVLGVHTSLTLGWESVLIPKFEPMEFAELLIKYKPNGIMGVPSYFEVLMNSPLLSNQDLSFVHVILVGGDKTPIELENEVNSFFAEHNSKIHLSKGYGMTEVSASSTLSYETANKVGSNGIPMSKTTVSAFDDNYKECTYNEKGEICICTPTVMIGYYGKKEEINKVLKEHKDGYKWIHTGDYGYIDEDGFVFVEGRIKRVIVRYDGFKVFPSLIEQSISKHDSVATCCVVGKPDKEHSQGALPVAFVVLKSDSTDKIKIRGELNEICSKELPEYVQPCDFIFRDSLPLTPIGKIDYKSLEKEINGDNV